MSIDKRVDPRHRKRLQLRYGLDEPTKIGFTEDISDTGIFIRSPVVMQPGKILHVDLQAGNGTHIRLKGRIMWAKRVPQNLMNKVKGGMGLRILGFEEGEEAYHELCAGLKR